MYRVPTCASDLSIWKKKIPLDFPRVNLEARYTCRIYLLAIIRGLRPPACPELIPGGSPVIGTYLSERFFWVTSSQTFSRPGSPTTPSNSRSSMTSWRLLLYFFLVVKSCDSPAAHEWLFLHIIGSSHSTWAPRSSGGSSRWACCSYACRGDAFQNVGASIYLR